MYNCYSYPTQQSIKNPFFGKLKFLEEKMRSGKKLPGTTELHQYVRAHRNEFSSCPSYLFPAQTMMIMISMTIIAHIIMIILIFFHQYLRFKVAADFSNCDAPSCN